MLWKVEAWVGDPEDKKTLELSVEWEFRKTKNSYIDVTPCPNLEYS